MTNTITIVIVLLLVILQNNKNVLYVYWNTRGTTGKNLQQPQKHQAKVTENEYRHLV